MRIRKNSHGAPHGAEASRALDRTFAVTSVASNFNFIHSVRTHALQKRLGLLKVELAIACLNAEKKPVA